MRTLSPRTPPPSSYSHAPHHTPNITAHEISSRIGLPLPEESCFGPHSLPYISLLPPEILAEIFLLCIPDSQFPLPYNNEAPISLSHVSSMWRALALSTPDLWTGLHLNYKDPAEDVPAAEMWLSRSGDKPLSLSIAIDFSEQPQQEIIDALCKHSSRWKHVRFEFRNLFCPPMYSLDMAMGDIGELRTFEFHARDISTINVEPITNLLASAPNLRQVTWVDDLADTDTLLQLPLNRLTHLSLSMDHGTLDREVLGACYNLEHIRLTRPFSLTSHSQEPLLLPKLSSINISSGIAGVLDHLVLPALRDVRIHGDNDHRDRALPLGHDAHSHLSGSWDPTPLLSLVGRSACSITSLSVGPPMTEAALMICLRGTGASLVTLRVQGVPVGDTLLEALTCRSSQLVQLARARAVGPSATITTPEGGNTTQDADGGMPLCPHLEELVLDTRVGCSSGVLAAMVESRLNRPGSQTTTAPPQSPEYTSSTEPFRISSLLSIEVIDGHKDLQRLKMLSAPAARSQRLADEDRDGRLALHIIPRKAASPNTRNYLFRRKLCASR